MAGGLYLSDDQGKIVPWLPGNVAAAAWFPDSRRVLAVAGEELTRWDQIEPLLTAADREDVMSRAQTYRDEIMAYGGDWKRFQPTSVKGVSDDRLRSIKVFLRDRLGKGLSDKLKSQWKEFERVTRTRPTRSNLPESR